MLLRVLSQRRAIRRSRSIPGEQFPIPCRPAQTSGPGRGLMARDGAASMRPVRKVDLHHPAQPARVGGRLCDDVTDAPAPALDSSAMAPPVSRPP